MVAENRILPRKIRERLTGALFGRRIYYLPETDSTNSVASELAGLGEPEGTVVITDYQRKGRGRLDRTWESPPMKDLLFSVILRPGGDSANVLTLTLAVSSAISAVLSAFVGREIFLKWPNDVVSDGRKLCGILAESSIRSGRPQHVVLGAGVNVNTTLEDFDPSIRDRAASCRTLKGEAFDRISVLVGILSAMEKCYFRFRKEGFVSFMDDYNKKLSILSKNVLFERDGRKLRGKVNGVGPDGALIVTLPSSKKLFLFSEEITVE